MLSLHTNTAALSAHSAMLRSQDGMATAMTRLATGYRINSSQDDAAGLQIATRLQAQTSGIGAAMRNTQNGMSMLQTADGALAESGTILIRMKDLATQAADASASAADREAMQAEYGALSNELSNISSGTTYAGVKLLLGATAAEQAAAAAAATAAANTQAAANTAVNTAVAVDALASTPATLAAIAAAAAVAAAASDTTVAAQAYSAAIAAVGVDGTFSAPVNFQIGAAASNIMAFDLSPHLNAMHAALHDAASLYNAFGLPNDAGGTDLTAGGSAAASIDKLDAAIGAVARVRSVLGAAANRLDHAHANLSGMSDNTRAASGRIMDADYARESANLTSSQMLLQMGTGMLQRSNSSMSTLITGLLS